MVVPIPVTPPVIETRELRRTFGNRRATKKASATGPAPRIAASMMSRMKPVSRDTRVSPPTVRIRSIIKLPCGINHRPLRNPLNWPRDKG